MNKQPICESGNKYIEYYQNERIEMLPYVPKNASRILDVGCSEGCFGNRLKTEACVEVWGVEPNARAAEIAAQKLDKVIHSTFDEGLDIPKCYFDCIIFNDVLEHLVDPYTALDIAKSLLKKGGSVTASIPNVRYFHNIWNLLIRREWEYVEEGVLDITHLRFFTCKSIVAMFESAGYEIKKVEGINPTPSRKFKLLNSLLFNQIEDMLYQQFAVVAKIK